MEDFFRRFSRIQSEDRKKGLHQNWEWFFGRICYV